MLSVYPQIKPTKINLSLIVRSGLCGPGTG